MIVIWLIVWLIAGHPHVSYDHLNFWASAFTVAACIDLLNSAYMD